MRWRAGLPGPFPVATGEGPCCCPPYAASMVSMDRAAVAAALLLVASPLVASCASDPTCDDVDGLDERLSGMDADDPDRNDVVNDLQRAEADCNT